MLQRYKNIDEMLDSFRGNEHLNEEMRYHVYQYAMGVLHAIANIDGNKFIEHVQTHGDLMHESYNEIAKIFQRYDAE